MPGGSHVKIEQDTETTCFGLNFHLVNCCAAAVPRYDDDVPAYGSMSVGCLIVVLIGVDNGEREPARRVSPMYAE